MALRSLPTTLSLVEIANQAADQLRQMKAAEPANPVMVFESCEIELNVEATISPSGKLSFGVLSVGTDAEYVNSHKIKLKFNAHGEIHLE